MFLSCSESSVPPHSPTCLLRKLELLKLTFHKPSLLFCLLLTQTSILPPYARWMVATPPRAWPRVRTGLICASGSYYPSSAWEMSSKDRLQSIETGSMKAAWQLSWTSSKTSSRCSKKGAQCQVQHLWTWKLQIPITGFLQPVLRHVHFNISSRMEMKLPIFCLLPDLLPLFLCFPSPQSPKSEIGAIPDYSLSSHSPQHISLTNPYCLKSHCPCPCPGCCVSHWDVSLFLSYLF